MGWVVGLVVAWLAWFVFFVVRYLYARRNMGTVATPRGPMPVPTDAELRRARHYYRNDPAIPMVRLTWIRPPDNWQDGGPKEPIPVPVPEGRVASLTINLGEGYTLPMRAQVLTVVARPGPWSGRPEDEAGPPTYQYVGLLLDGEAPARVQFNHEDVWEVEPVVLSLEGE